MSEDSASFHLRTSNPAHVVELLRRARVPGFVFPPANGYCTFVCPRDAAARDAVIAANLGLLVDYAYAADHGCTVNVYERDVKVASLKAAFEEPRARFDRDAFIDIGLVDIRAADAIAEWVRGDRGDDAHEHLVAEKLGLPRFASLSYRDALADEAPSPGRIEVDRDGRSRTAEDAARDEIDELLATLPPTRKAPGAPFDAGAPPQTPPRRRAKTRFLPVGPRATSSPSKPVAKAKKRAGGAKKARAARAR